MGQTNGVSYKMVLNLNSCAFILLIFAFFRLDSSASNLKCGDCDKEFRNRLSLIQHLKTHSTFAAYKCDECKERFKLKKYLNSHMVKHTGMIAINA